MTVLAFASSIMTILSLADNASDAGSGSWAGAAGSGSTDGADGSDSSSWLSGLDDVVDGCIEGSGQRTGYAITGDVAATFATQVGNITCASGYQPVSTAAAPFVICNFLTSTFEFQGCGKSQPHVFLVSAPLAVAPAQMVAQLAARYGDSVRLVSSQTNGTLSLQGLPGDSTSVYDATAGVVGLAGDFSLRRSVTQPLGLAHTVASLSNLRMAVARRRRMQSSAASMVALDTLVNGPLNFGGLGAMAQSNFTQLVSSAMSATAAAISAGTISLPGAAILTAAQVTGLTALATQLQAAVAPGGSVSATMLFTQRFEMVSVANGTSSTSIPPTISVVDMQQLASASLNGALQPSDFIVVALDPLTGRIVGDSNPAPTPTPDFVPKTPDSSSFLFCNDWKCGGILLGSIGTLLLCFAAGYLAFIMRRSARVGGRIQQDGVATPTGKFSGEGTMSVGLSGPAAAISGGGTRLPPISRKGTLPPLKIGLSGEMGP